MRGLAWAQASGRQRGQTDNNVIKRGGGCLSGGTAEDQAVKEIAGMDKGPFMFSTNPCLSRVVHRDIHTAHSRKATGGQTESLKYEPLKRCEDPGF